MLMTELYQKLIEHFGSQTKTARHLCIKQTGVYNWLIGKTKMGVMTAKRAEIITNGRFIANSDILARPLLTVFCGFLDSFSIFLSL